jgi:hypothetical protein
VEVASTGASAGVVAGAVTAGGVVVFDGVGAAGSQPRAAKLKTANMLKYFFIVALQLFQ